MSLKKLLLSNLLILFILSSCETDFDINAPWKDITVVYGLLNQNDNTHYVRIQKAFLGEGNALHMALIPDSNLYPNNIHVTLQEWEGPNLKRTFNMDTVSIENKEPGTFFNPKQPVYFTIATLSPAYLYKLKVLNINTQKEISSQTELVNDFTIDRPGFGANLNFSITPETPIIVKWYSANYGKRYQVVMRFNYTEVITGTTDTLYKHIDWYSAVAKSKSLEGGELMEIKINKSVLENMIIGNIPKKMEVTRKLAPISFLFQVAADDLNTFIDVNEPSSSIIQDKPEFSNITNGIGIFSARYEKVRMHQLHPSTRQQIFAMEGYNFQ
ncbi:MAG: hypothetical protein U1C46_06765 [Bacteroidales bacterium]|nr:hypothetical protein [Bacteroidales bacterium]MDZ4204505.1 hypothetical protein [Bacteroidales bacterium]